MRNTELFEKIRNVECTEEEIEKIIDMANKGDLDSTAPFSRYYRLADILKCIGLYEEGKISHKLLTRWAIAYDALISGGRCYCEPKPEEYNAENNCDTVPVGDIVSSCIREWLDSLSFCDEEEENESERESDDEELFSFKSAREHKEVFCHLDRIYNSLEDWEITYTHDVYDFGDGLEETEDIVLLFTNHNAKEFFIICNASYDFHDNKPEAPLVTYGEFERKAGELSKNGYKNLEY